MTSSASSRPEDENLGIGANLAYGLQHVLTMYGGIIAVPLIIGQAAGLSSADVGLLIAASLFAGGLATLLQTLDFHPTLVIGHSAGAAVAVRMALDRLIQPQAILGLNAALLPLRGLAGQLFSPVARLMAGSSLVPRFFSARAGEPAVLRRLLESTGSTLDAEGMALYGQLVSNPGHATGALGMMANWDLQTLAEQLPRLNTALDLVVGSRDHTVPPSQADRVLARLAPGQSASITRLEGLGHLAHEEQAGLVAELVLARYLAKPQG